MAKRKTSKKRSRARVTAAKPRSATRRKRRRRARRNPIGELATMMMANGGRSMPKRRRRRRTKSRRRRAVGALARMAPRRRRRRRRHAHGGLPRAVTRRARRNPEGIGGLLSDAAFTTVGVLAARFAQNLAAMKLEQKATGSPTAGKASAGKPLYIAIGTAVPLALGLATKKLAKKERIGNNLLVGAVTFGVHELARQFVFSKAPETSPLYALGEDLGELAQGEDGTEWARVPGRGWYRLAPEGQLSDGEELEGYEPRSELGFLPPMVALKRRRRRKGKPALQSLLDLVRATGARLGEDEDLSGYEPRSDLGEDELEGYEPRSDLGSYSDPGQDFGDDEDGLGSYQDPGQDFGDDEDLSRYSVAGDEDE